MNCRHCGRYYPPDPETGYDADDYCLAQDCQRERERVEDGFYDDERFLYAAERDAIDAADRWDEDHHE